MSDCVAVPRVDGLTDWYYLEGDKIRHVIKIGFRIKLERLFQYESPEDAFEFFQARQQERSDLLRKWGKL